MSISTKIIYTFTDEAPALATYSLLPIVKAFTASIGIDVQTRNISLAWRILSNFPEQLSSKTILEDHLAELSDLTVTPEANIIKLPNISASTPQLQAAIKELQAQGYALPDYPEIVITETQKEIRARYDKIKGSAVNHILREGNSDRYIPLSVKNYARKHPHKMGTWIAKSKSHIAHMSHGDFYGSEKALTIEATDTIKIELITKDGTTTVLKEKTFVQSGEIIDTAVLSKKALRAFIASEIEDAKKQGILLSVHLKATMMKISDPIIFGQIVTEFYKDVITKHTTVLKQIGFNQNNGIGDLYARIKTLSAAEQAQIESDIQTIYAVRPSLAMVDFDKGITNLHMPNNVIIDSSMPTMIRNSGKMYDIDGELRDTKAIIPDRCYATIYQAIIEDCKSNGAFDPTTMGSVRNIGLMAKRAEEYGSHDKTFQVGAEGVVQVTDSKGNVLMEQNVGTGDIFRMCQTKDEPIQDWVKLAVDRTRTSSTPAIFWLDPRRSHDSMLAQKVQVYLKNHNTEYLDIRIMSPVDAMKLTLERTRKGLNTISVTGNVLRDYLTDLFPIMELGSSSKILSIIPLLNDGRVFETGAGGSAPKHMQQLIEENFLRWDSLGEFMALAASLEHFSIYNHNPEALVLSKTLDQANSQLLDNNKSPARKVGNIDNRGSHFYLALYWAQALATQTEDISLQAQFARLAKTLSDNEVTIVAELNAVHGKPLNLGGYYAPNPELTSKAMRPSNTLNTAIAKLK
ncbi:NADP-dependent isocitrate dehydrogenase [Candidatus Pseudomonas adelgestsugas]|uniref:Isocitrate dehydrogenase [NADP] n=1 Tax=Candidatus Pseudomonas adelgestsugas TaxID=1302376 RepID=A0ABX5R8U9_9PSED|nr:NADP-dependent isocitrate dehydrogenase [Candidatus Pseudomonas adelgestsugas]QAX81794.1 Isocitrate dehydrogenase [NADP] [Candidatus Pseudomonas adelgestsugas]